MDFTNLLSTTFFVLFARLLGYLSAKSMESIGYRLHSSKYRLQKSDFSANSNVKLLKWLILYRHPFYALMKLHLIFNIIYESPLHTFDVYFLEDRFFLNSLNTLYNFGILLLGISFVNSILRDCLSVALRKRAMIASFFSRYGD